MLTVASIEWGLHFKTNKPGYIISREGIAIVSLRLILHQFQQSAASVTQNPTVQVRKFQPKKGKHFFLDKNNQRYIHFYRQIRFACLRSRMFCFLVVIIWSE